MITKILSTAILITMIAVLVGIVSNYGYSIIMGEMLPKSSRVVFFIIAWIIYYIGRR